MNNRIGLGIIGGLGDVSIIRKYPALFKTDLENSFTLLAIADLYQREIVKDKKKFDELIQEIKTKRLKSPMEDVVELFLKTRIANGTEYQQIQNNELSTQFLDKIEGGVLDISTPNKYHVPLIIQGLKKGKCHILFEKPVASSLEEAVELEEFLKTFDLNGRVIMDAEHYSHYGHVKEFIENTRRYAGNKGFGLGKITGLELSIEEDEGFASQRNRDIINVKKSGGGIWLDTGVHAIGFLRNIGARIDYSAIEAQPFKLDDENIAGAEYGETGMHSVFEILPNKEFAKGCRAEISVAKGAKTKNKKFNIKYESGRAEIDIGAKKLSLYSKGSLIYESVHPQDAFYGVFDGVRKAVMYNQTPLTSCDKAIANVKDVFIVYSKSKPIQLVK